MFSYRLHVLVLGRGWGCLSQREFERAGQSMGDINEAGYDMGIVSSCKAIVTSRRLKKYLMTRCYLSSAFVSSLSTCVASEL